MNQRKDLVRRHISSNLRRLGSGISVPITPDAEGYVGRECPEKACLGYFKITPGTGIKGKAPCHCPYCGWAGDQDKFWTPDQIKYAQSVAIHRVADAVVKDLKSLESNHPPQGLFGIGFRITVEGRLPPLRHYREKRLETEVICDRCTLRYAIYGVFGFCPDCGIHNSLQILESNLQLAEKEITLASQVAGVLAEHLTGNALEDAVSSFDGFGRETCRIRATSATAPDKADKVSFQNLVGARKRIEELFGFDLASAVPAADWDFACRSFQKRHLLAHSMGIVDHAYLQATSDTSAVVGRKVVIIGDDVLALIGLLRKLAASLVKQLPNP